MEWMICRSYFRNKTKCFIPNGFFKLKYSSIWKEISPECSLEGLLLKLKLQYFGHMMRRTDSLEKPLMLGKSESRRRRRWQRMRWLDGITNSMNMNLSKLGLLRWRTGEPGQGYQKVGRDLVTEQQQQLVDNVTFTSDVQQNDSVIYIYIFFFFGFFSIVGYHKILNTVPCAIQ